MRRKSRDTLSHARSLFARRRFSELISFLSPQIFLYRKDPEYHELLGYACFYTGDYGGAHSYFQRVKDISPQRVSGLLGLALVMVRRRRITDALQLWLEILDIQPNNAQARKALKLARIYEEDDWLKIIEERRYGPVLPRLPNPWVGYTIKTFAVLVIIGTLSWGGWLIINQLRPEPVYRSGQELLDFSSSQYTQGDYSQVARFIFTDDELEDEMQALQLEFRRFEDNLVRYRGNRILLSNAPLEVKDRIAIIIDQLQEPDFTNFQGDFDYSSIAKDPELFHGVYVRWKGRVANLSYEEDAVRFDLLVGFESGRVLEGTIPVYLDFPVELAGGQAVEAIGEILSRDGVLRLRGSSLRRIIVDSQ